MKILRVEDVTKLFGKLRAVDGVSFSLDEGQIISLIGPNGAGKSTLANIICGLHPPDSGEVWYRDNRITGLAPEQIARLGVGRLLQTTRVFAGMTVLENVALALPYQRGENIFVATFARKLVHEEEHRNLRKAEKLLELAGLEQKAYELAGNLSFAEQRFLTLIRTLAMKPDVLILDEPSVGLDREAIGRVVDLLRSLTKDEGKTILLIEHNMDVVTGVSDYVIMLVEGRVLMVDLPAEIRKNARVLEAYLGSGYASTS